MRRKNLIVQAKAKNIKALQPKIKIKKLYKKFKKKVLKNIKKEQFALAVSGGSDSMCLAYFSKMYASEYKNKIHTLIVNNKLRKESDKEALKVKKILKQKKIQSKILNWKKKIPTKNIQSQARNMRYSLMSDYCEKKKLNI